MAGMLLGEHVLMSKWTISTERFALDAPMRIVPRLQARTGMPARSPSSLVLGTSKFSGAFLRLSRP